MEPSRRGDGRLNPRDVWVCVTYMFLATAMWVVNKKTVKHLPVPFFVMLVQTVATVALLKLSHVAGFIRMKPYRWEIFGQWLLTGFVWAIPLALNLRALTRLNPETLIVFRTATLIGVALGDSAYGKTFTKRELSSIVTILSGCFVYAWYDAQYDAEGYMWASLYWLAMVTSMLYVKHAFSMNKDLNVWEKTTYLNATAAPPLGLFSLLFECSSSSYASMSSVGSFWLIASCLMGVALASASNKSRDFMSATAFDVMSTGSKFLTILVSGLIFESLYTPQSLGGLLVAVAGGSLYSPMGAWFLKCVGLGAWVRDAEDDARRSARLPTARPNGAGADPGAGPGAGVAPFAWRAGAKNVTWASGLGGDDSPSRRNVP